MEPDGGAVLRLVDEQGAIRVKLGASSDGSGLVLLNDATEPGAQIVADGDGTTLTLKNKDGQERVVTP